MATFDVETARSKFPAFKEDQVFLDNAGGSQILGSVVESISDYLIKSNVQFGGGYKVSKASSSRYDDGITAGAKFLNAQKDEIAYGSSATQLLRNLSFTFPFQEGDEIVLSAIDHEANIAPWKSLAERLKLVIKSWVPQEGSTNPKLLPEDLKGLLSPKTRLVTCTHASNILGTIHDVKAIAEVVHTIPNALLCVDGVSYAPHRPVDVKELGVDFYVLSWYKVFGPHIAMLYASRKAQEQMGTLGHWFNSQVTLENKITLGSCCYELVQSIPAVTAYLGPAKAGSWGGLHAQETLLQTTLLEYLTSKPNITIYGERSADEKLRLPTVSFKVAGLDSRELVETLERTTNFGFRWGAFYSNYLVNEYFGLDASGVVRVSMVHYNTLEEVKGLIEAMDGVISKI
ncbi:PLP-dependent transferase [Annulohypoxylon maeteangense]|uniref:PLP-dependent transferase n=1 Tax=Annulohypoxylon maeteangense TaxID=1927788 RepID=UPI002007764F|nr:PLP-dependent transferase [Annulohypoxylon maeteangense]KAI0890629.1 PLP-dependent transferase [Annulohypoxylon maeteangense]